MVGGNLSTLLRKIVPAIFYPFKVTKSRSLLPKSLNCTRKSDRFLARDGRNELPGASLAHIALSR
jgi:hypothetical protein